MFSYSFFSMVNLSYRSPTSTGDYSLGFVYGQSDIFCVCFLQHSVPYSNPVLYLCVISSPKKWREVIENKSIILKTSLETGRVLARHKLDFAQSPELIGWKRGGGF